MNQMKTPLFRVRINATNLWADVFLHPNVRALRRLANYKGQTSVSDADAFCWQTGVFRKDGTIVELHFAKELLNPDTISHECGHAVWYFMRWSGLEGEEEMCLALGTLVGRITDQFIEMGIPIKRIAKEDRSEHKHKG